MRFKVGKRTRESYLERLIVKSHSTKEATRIALKLFDKFTLEKHEQKSDEIIQELLKIKTEEEKINATCDVCQSWINWLASQKKNPKTIKAYFSRIKLFLHYMGIRLTNEDIRNGIDFPKLIKEKKYPLTQGQIHDILEVASFDKKSLYLALSSSGMHIGEAVQVRKKDIVSIHPRISIYLNAKTTKTQSGRTVYLSKEAGSKIIGKLRRIEDDNLLF